jgi:hypothetical protein
MTHQLALLLLTQMPGGLSGSACPGAAPSISNVTTAMSTNADGLSRYTLTVAVTNVGAQGQKANVLQSVDIFLDRAKNGEKGVPPLRAGQTYSFTYGVSRAQDARPGSTSVDLRIVNDAGHSLRTCDAAIGTYRVHI